LDYCDIIYSHVSIEFQNKLQKLQNQCVRFIFGLKKFEHISNYYDKLNWLHLDKRRLLHLGCFIYKLYKNNSPQYILKMLQPTSIIHNYNTRNHLFIPKTNSKYSKFTFDYFGSHFWNNIPLVIRNNENIYLFKKKLIEYLSTL